MDWGGRTVGWGRVRADVNPWRIGEPGWCCMVLVYVHTVIVTLRGDVVEIPVSRQVQAGCMVAVSSSIQLCCFPSQSRPVTMTVP